MGMDILVMDSGLYVNNQLRCLDKYKHKLHVVKINSGLCHEKTGKVLDLSHFCKEYSTAKGTGYDSWQYRLINDHKKDIVDILLSKGYKGSWYRDVIILGDMSLDALYVLNVLQKSEYDGDIHLILPLPFERTVKGSIHYELLTDMSKVRSLAIYDPYKLSMEEYGNIEVDNVERVVNEKTAYLLERYDSLFEKMIYMDDSNKYFYDFNVDSFVDTDSLYVLDDYEITHTLGRLIDPYMMYGDEEENDYLIGCLNTPIPRPDGKEVCSKLRSIRHEFAVANGIDYKFRECTYDGPCAGTCAACDKEARELSEHAKRLSHVIYPEVDMED